jgi:hypothetical protein
MTRSALPRIALLALIWGSAFLWIKLDASIAAVRMARMLGVSHFARWDRPRAALADNDVPPTFLEGVPPEQEAEDDTPASGHEGKVSTTTRAMLGWIVDQTHHASWRMFTGFSQRLYVANANRETAETTLGTDLI